MNKITFEYFLNDVYNHEVQEKHTV